MLCFLRSEERKKQCLFNRSVQVKSLMLPEMLTDQMKIEGRIELSPV